MRPSLLNKVVISTATILSSLVPVYAAPAAAPNKSNVSAQNAYASRLQAKVAKEWLLPDGKNHVVISMIVNPDGSVENIQVVSAPKSAAAEDAANAAFIKVEPLEPLPAGCSKRKMDITFESTASQHSSSSQVYVKLTPIAESKAAAPATDTGTK